MCRVQRAPRLGWAGMWLCQGRPAQGHDRGGCELRKGRRKAGVGKDGQMDTDTGWEARRGAFPLRPLPPYTWLLGWFLQPSSPGSSWASGLDPTRLAQSSWQQRQPTCAGGVLRAGALGVLGQRGGSPALASLTLGHDEWGQSQVLRALARPTWVWAGDRRGRGGQGSVEEPVCMGCRGAWASSRPGKKWEPETPTPCWNQILLLGAEGAQLARGLTLPLICSQKPQKEGPAPLACQWQAV